MLEGFLFMSTKCYNNLCVSVFKNIYCIKTFVYSEESFFLFSFLLFQNCCAPLKAIII